MRPHASIFILPIIAVLAVSGLAAETTRQGEQRRAIQKQLELRLGEANQRLSSLPDRTSGMKDETRRELVRLREELKKKQEAASRKLSQLGSATGQEFDRMKAELNAAIEDLNVLYQRMSSLSRSS